MAPRQKEPAPISGAERKLFLEAMDQVKPDQKRDIQESPPSQPKKKSPGTQPSRPQDESFASLFEKSFEAHPDLVLKRSDLPDAKPNERKAAVRNSGPDAVIDLHACTAEVALKRTHEFLLRCKQKRFRKVLIIHGKGSGILREAVRGYLAHHALVISVEDAQRQHGGSGAAIVILRVG